MNTFNLKTSITYLESETGRLYSGNPGYARGSPVLIGKKEIKVIKNSQGSSTQEE